MKNADKIIATNSRYMMDMYEKKLSEQPTVWGATVNYAINAPSYYEMLNNGVGEMVSYRLIPYNF